MSQQDGIVNTGVDNPMSVYSEPGGVALWVAFAFTFTAAVVLGFLSYIRNVRPEARLTYYIVTLINAVAAVAYLTMATGESYVYDESGEVMETHDDTGLDTHNGIRHFEWLRFAMYSVTGPLTILVLGLLAGGHWVDIVYNAVAHMGAVGLFFAAVVSEGELARWPLFTLGALFLVPNVYAVFYKFAASAHKVHPEVGKLYTVLSYLFVVMTIAYVIAIAVSEIGYVTTVDQELIIYATFDIFTKAFFGFGLIMAREAIARYGSYLGHFNTGADFDFPIQRSTHTGSGANYSTEGSAAVQYGEHRDTAFVQLRAATGKSA